MIAFTIPGKAKSAANLREHWRVRASRVKAERTKAMTLCPKWREGPLLVVTLTRHGVRELDGDNLQSALKGTRDGIAARLQVDDATRLVEWRYRQAQCKTGDECVTVEIGVSQDTPTVGSGVILTGHHR